MPLCSAAAPAARKRDHASLQFSPCGTLALETAITEFSSCRSVIPFKCRYRVHPSAPNVSSWGILEPGTFADCRARRERHRKLRELGRLSRLSFLFDTVSAQLGGHHHSRSAGVAPAAPSSCSGLDGA